MKMYRKIFLVITALITIFIFANCDGTLTPEDESDLLDIVPSFIEGKSISFYPDTYQALNWVQYTFFIDDTAEAGNDEVGYSNEMIKWEYSYDREFATLTFDYEASGYEIYTLYNKKAPSSYQAEYLYLYEGYPTYGSSVTYEGSWDPQDVLGENEAIVACRVGDMYSWDEHKIYLDGELKKEIGARGIWVGTATLGDHNLMVELVKTGSNPQTHYVEQDFELKTGGYIYNVNTPQ